MISPYQYVVEVEEFITCRFFIQSIYHLLGILGSGISELLTGPVKCVSSEAKSSKKDKEAENEVKTEESKIGGRKRLCWCGK